MPKMEAAEIAGIGLGWAEQGLIAVRRDGRSDSPD